MVRGVIFSVRGVIFSVRGVIFSVRGVIFSVRGVIFSVRVDASCLVSCRCTCLWRDLQWFVV